MPGQLYVVATPIGNLEDITFRAVRVLKEVSAIACEDTRQTRKLLEHYAISTPLVSYHEHNEKERAGELLERMESGATVALVTDAGTPLVSDPGYRLVAAAIEAGIPVTPVPGPAAPLAALAAAGLPTHRFRFLGFLPPKPGRRQAVLAALGASEETTILFEAPHRVVATLREIEDALGPARPVVAAREITKLHEEFVRGTASEVRQDLASRPSLRGEFTILIGPSVDGSGPTAEAVDYRQELEILLGQGVARMDAVKQLARRYGLGKRDVYRLIEEGS
jgi:16S rRNA (cytidine1402-2'-O)-methyltransferase